MIVAVESDALHKRVTDAMEKRSQRTARVEFPRAVRSRQSIPLTIDQRTRGAYRQTVKHGILHDLERRQATQQDKRSRLAK